MRGGYRENAGRKRMPEEQHKVTASFTITEDAKRKADCLKANGISISKAIDQTIKEMTLDACRGNKHRTGGKVKIILYLSPESKNLISQFRGFINFSEQVEMAITSLYAGFHK